MKKHYSISKDSQRNHREVHTMGCKYQPDIYHREYLGFFSSSDEAAAEATQKHGQACMCKYCCSGQVEDLQL
ncbi:hypothetical protein P0136_06340 [Lentisphaerota bacterium ZTH]|nr:hypothetical protein JYG24_02550 [Lentisphaerota bacterium]WET07608.1 hypothetical protein P0136_06340 [Lentisphaerota bacterium ZTH]